MEKLSLMPMRAKTIIDSALCLLLAAAFIAPLRADDLADKGREIFNKYQHAVVTVQMVTKTKMSFGGAGEQSNETKQDLTGTVLDPSGLTVLSLSACEPGEMMQNIMSGAGGDGGAKFKLNTELSDVKFLLEDGTEAPAEVVLRDKDRDLAFIRPKTKPAKPMASLDLSQAAPARILDQVIALNRLGQAAGRAYAVSVERVSAVVQKPRLFYIPESSATSTSMGCPAFSLDGKVIGIFLMRTVSSQGSGGMASMFSMRPDGLTPIILPAADVLKAANQAPEPKEDAKKE
jgi:S1-C subfamily serine protease